MEGSTCAIDSSFVPQAPDDASFDLAPSPTSLKEQRDCIKMMLLGITYTVTSGDLTQLFNCRRARNDVFSMNWAPLDTKPLRVTFDEIFAYLESLKDLHDLNPIALFEQEVEQRLTDLQA